MKNTAVTMLIERGVNLDEIARLVWELQSPYNPSLAVPACREALEGVLRKREVQYVVITGITLDAMAEAGELDEPLGSIVRENNRLFAVDQILAAGIVNIYGSIGLSNFGYLGEERPGCLGRMGAEEGRVDTFLDDLLAAIVAATCAKIAHNAQEGAL